MRLRRPTAFLALLAAAGVVAALLLSGGSPSKPNAADGASTSGAATVERRDLVATDTQAGTLSYAAPQTVYDRLSGTITWLPHVGRLIKPGGVLFTVDGAPVILLDGATPAYRALAPGMSDGRDILQLNRNLVALGFDPDGIAIDDEWQASTTAGVEELQSSLGEAETGKLTLGRVVFLPGEQLVSGLDATLGADSGGSASGSPSSSGASDPRGAGTSEYASFQTPAPAAMASAAKPKAPPQKRPPGSAGSRSVQRLEAQLARLKAELTQLKARGAGTSPAGNSGTPNSPGSPSSGSSDPGGSTGGSGGASPTPILQTTSTRLVVTVELEASKQSEARTGEAVTVALPDGETVGATITAVSAVAQSSNGNTANGGASGQGTGGNGSGGSSSTVPVTITLHGPHMGAGLDQAAVSVNFVQAVARNVLSVPVTALLATGGAAYAVQEVASPHRVIPVTTGLFAAGDVQISGAGIHPGLQVSDSQG